MWTTILEPIRNEEMKHCWHPRPVVTYLLETHKEPHIKPWNLQEYLSTYKLWNLRVGTFTYLRNLYKVRCRHIIPPWNPRSGILIHRRNLETLGHRYQPTLEILEPVEGHTLLETLEPKVRLTIPNTKPLNLGVSLPTPKSWNPSQELAYIFYIWIFDNLFWERRKQPTFIHYTFRTLESNDGPMPGGWGGGPPTTETTSGVLPLCILKIIPLTINWKPKLHFSIFYTKCTLIHRVKKDDSAVFRLQLCM